MNRFQFKLFLASFMVLDHISFFIPVNMSLWFHVLTRFVGVGFAYLAVEGFLYTKNVKRYLLRLYGAAALMFLGNLLINYLFSSRHVIVGNNIFLTLALGVTALAALRSISSKAQKYGAVLAILLIGFVFSEGGLIILPFILITYLNYDKPTRRNLGYLLWAGCLLLTTIFPLPTTMTLTDTLLMNPDFCFISIIPILHLYNHQLGLKNRFSQSFFYIFYPAHLWLLAILQFLMTT